MFVISKIMAGSEVGNIVTASTPLIEDEDDSASNGPVINYRELYEQEVDKRRALTKLAQKATRDYDDLKFRYRETNKMVDVLQVKLCDSENQLRNLQNVSEAVYHEYDDLKTRYEVEHENMSQTLSKDTELYKQNKCLRRETAALRRQSAIFLHKLPEDDMDLEIDYANLEGISDEESKGSIEDHYLEGLLQRIKDLEAEVLVLSADLTKAKEDEFEAQEGIVDLRRQLEESVCKIAELQETLENNEKFAESLTHTLSKRPIQREDLSSKEQTENDLTDTAIPDTSEVRCDHATLSRQNALISSILPTEDRYRKATEKIQELPTEITQQMENKRNGELTLEYGSKGKPHRMEKKKYDFLEEEIRRNRKTNNKSEANNLGEVKEEAGSVINRDTSNNNIQKYANILVAPPHRPPRLLGKNNPPPPPPRIPIHLEAKNQAIIPAPHRPPKILIGFGHKTQPIIPPPPPLPQISLYLGATMQEIIPPPPPLPQVSLHLANSKPVIPLPEVALHLGTNTQPIIPPPPPLPELSMNKGKEVQPIIPQTSSLQELPMHSTIPPPPPPPPPIMKASAVNIIRAVKTKKAELETPKAPAMDDLIDQIRRGGIQLKKTPNNGVPRKIRPVASTPKVESPINEMKSILNTMKKIRSNKLSQNIPNSQQYELSIPSATIGADRLSPAPYSNSESQNSSILASPVLQRKLPFSKPLVEPDITGNANCVNDIGNKACSSTMNRNRKVDTSNLLSVCSISDKPLSTNLVKTSHTPGRSGNLVSSTTIFLCGPNSQVSPSSKIC